MQAGLSGGDDHALACLLALNALRVSEACGADLVDLALANGHRTLRIVGKGNQPALIPLAPRTTRAIDTAVGERTDGPLLARADGSRLDRHAAGRIVRRVRIDTDEMSVNKGLLVHGSHEFPMPGSGLCASPWLHFQAILPGGHTHGASDARDRTTSTWVATSRQAAMAPGGAIPGYRDVVVGA